MRFAGIDIAAETHFVSVVDEKAEAVVKPTSFKEDAAGYEKLFGLLGPPGDLLVAMEATGHYWQNLFAALAAAGYAVALLNPLRTHRFAGDIERTLKAHEVGTLLTTLDGIGPTTAARLVAELGDIASFRDAAAIASYVGVSPGLRQSGKRQANRAALTPYGNARLRAALWMPTLTAVRKNPWLRAYYEGLLARGKLPKVALIAAMRKLLIAVYFVAKNRRPFVPILVEART